MLMTVEVAETLFEHASLWAIRLALLAMFVGFAMELCGYRRVSPVVRWVWLFGALNALAHSLGALFFFHDGSHAKAFESTAQQTEDLLGIAVGFGLYVNYLFVAVWLMDAGLRWIAGEWYGAIGVWYWWIIYGFLSFIAINGAIVFKDGWVRWLGVLAVLVLVLLAWFTRRARGEKLVSGA